MVVLQQQPAAWGQGLGGSLANAANRIEAIKAPIQGPGRFVVAYHRLQGRPNGRGDVRGIGNHQLQLPPKGLQRLPPAAQQQLNRCLGPLPWRLKVAGGDGDGFRAVLHRKTPAPGPSPGQSQG